MRCKVVSSTDVAASGNWSAAYHIATDKMEEIKRRIKWYDALLEERRVLSAKIQEAYCAIGVDDATLKLIRKDMKNG